MVTQAMSEFVRLCPCSTSMPPSSFFFLSFLLLLLTKAVSVLQDLSLDTNVIEEYKGKWWPDDSKMLLKQVQSLTNTARRKLRMVKTGYDIPSPKLEKSINWKWLGQQFAQNYAHSLDWMVLSKAKINYILNVGKQGASAIVESSGIKANRLVFLLDFCLQQEKSSDGAIDDLFSTVIEPSES